ncbi:hypothetical protein NQ317_015316 [Molorchus minor]|uniref:Uncharacterized protein n=1 Tax=Molorchus minor TaxID=1323400 RepID=A0ABQ9JCL3_9CUCU|nr:hypothetical protein NQ317_015316 [Molorchus minor]
MSGYDCHLFINELCTPGVKVDVLAQNNEKYISFTKHLYMHDYVTKKGEKTKKFNLMRGKGVFPYSFVDNLDELKFPVLPSKDKFFDKLNNVHITYQDYERAKSDSGLSSRQLVMA